MVKVTVEWVMRHPDFRRGFSDYRRGRKPDFDDPDRKWKWLYEWGRQFAAVAPRDMVIVLAKKRTLNPKAIKLFERSKFLEEICP
jgi:hypothetical protein